MNDWQKIKHLYLRAGFGMTPEEAFQKRENPNLKGEVARFFKKTSHRPAKVPKEFEGFRQQIIAAAKAKDKKARRDAEVKARKLTIQVNTDWIREMATTDNPLLEKMTLFWHGHFACHIRMPNFATKQLNTLRQYALGNFKELVLAIAKDPAMIFYLNNQQNTKRQPNENFARELMELFTIGIGNYTEQDVKEAARAFTGWKADKIKAEFRFVGKQHDPGSKTFMGKTGEFGGEDIIDTILENKETARFIARKMYRYFVNPQLNESHALELADTFYNSGYDIAQTMRHMLESDWFYDKTNVGVKIKSPVELLVGIVRTFGIESNHKLIKQVQIGLGQVLFKPPNVAGWPGDRTWIDNSTLMMRLNLPFRIFSSKKSPIQADIGAYAQHYQNKEASDIASDLVDILLQIPPSTGEGILSLQMNGKNPNNQLPKIIQRVASLPEYQLC